MKAISRGSLMVFALLLIAAGLRAQWSNVAPGLLGNDPGFGAMQYRDGIVWAGYQGLWESLDAGTTWQYVKGFPAPAATITDISFYDNMTGLVATFHSVYMTKDGGASWTAIINSPNSQFYKVSFNGSPLTIHALIFDGILYSSVDGGVNWNTTNAGSITRSFAVAIDRTVYDFEQFGNGFGAARISSDIGNSFSADGQNIDGDCYTISVDSCDSKRLYLVSEEIISPSDQTAKLYLSIDGGLTWQATASQTAPYYSGAMTTTWNGVFAGTISADGVLRSLDQGMTWKSIGGPPTSPDSRVIAAVDDNIILAADPSGNIWRTKNSGGDSVPGGASLAYGFQPASLFTPDSLSPCDPAVTDTILINASACVLPNVKGETISGIDSADYSIKTGINRPFSALDTVIISFVPSDTGARNGAYQVTLDDGIVMTVPLLGYGNPGHILSLATANGSTDTIGATVNVPVKIGGLIRAEEINIVMHYDTRLQYKNSFDMSGAKVDIPGQQWAGRSELHFPNAVPGTQQGYASFNVWSDTTGQPLVTFDSLDVLSAAPCEYVLPPPDTSVITPIAGCGIELLSRLVHLGEEPRFSVEPNPSSGDVSISCDYDIGNVTIAVYDMLGAERSSISVSVTKSSPARVALPEAAGVYYIRVISQAGVENMNLVVSR